MLTGSGFGEPGIKVFFGMRTQHRGKFLNEIIHKIQCRAALAHGPLLFFASIFTGRSKKRTMTRRTGESLAP